MSNKNDQKPIRVVLLGFGGVSKTFCSILLSQEDSIRSQLGGRSIQIVGICSSKLALYAENGFETNSLPCVSTSDLKAKADLIWTHENGHSQALLKSAKCDYDVLIDVSPTNIKTGEPGLSCIRIALDQDHKVILASKGALIADFKGLSNHKNFANLKFSATVCCGLPVVNVGTRDILCTKFESVRGIFNACSNFVLDMLLKGSTYDQAIANAKEMGIVEPDPSLDIDGIDTAIKLCIISNTILKHPCKLSDIKTTGVRTVTPEMVKKAASSGNGIRLIAEAKRTDDGYDLSVAPREVPMDSFFGQCSGTANIIEFQTELFEKISLILQESSLRKNAITRTTAGAILRDLIHLFA